MKKTNREPVLIGDEGAIFCLNLRPYKLGDFIKMRLKKNRKKIVPVR